MPILTVPSLQQNEIMENLRTAKDTKRYTDLAVLMPCYGRPGLRPSGLGLQWLGT